jgi:membrane-bound serine protease (ClpP class)
MHSLPLPLRPARLIAWAACATTCLALLAGTSRAAVDDSTDRVLVTTIAGPITPVVAAHIDDGIGRAESEGYGAYLVRLDTPGGLDTSMRAIVQDILASQVPVIVHIAPQGARGASAGAIITFAAHIAAMAPGTSIGAATPIAGDTGDDLEAKVVNDAIAYAESLAELRGRDSEFIADTVREGSAASASEALELGAIDVVAATTAELLEVIDGTTVEVGDELREVVLRTAGAPVDTHDMGLMRTIQQFLADPNIAFLLLSIGTLGLIYELASPGLGVGGALGLTFILLALFGLAVLPLQLVGGLFLVLAVVLFIAEVAAPGVGLAAAGGALSLVLSAVFIIDDAPGLSISLSVIVPTAIVLAAFVIVAGRIAMRVRTAPSPTTGAGVLVGHRAVVHRHDTAAQVFVNGAWWSVEPLMPLVDLADGDTVEVVEVDGLRLVVEPVAPALSTDPGGST